MTEAKLLCETACGSMFAAAGCGKTETIARAVASAQGRQLVLTHTNAGVDAIRRRLRRNGVGNAAASVDTIAGWSLKYVLAYPKMCGGWRFEAKAPLNWDSLYPTMTRLLDNPFIREIISASYDGIFVDEYQDCTVDQHDLIRKLTAILPTRVLGDPMQAIFGFGGTELPDWLRTVENDFPRVGSLDTPWRWRREGYNGELGNWLIDARDCLGQRRTLDLCDPRIERHTIPSSGGWAEVAKAVSFERGRLGGTCAAIMKWPGRNGYHLFAKLTGGYYQALESIEAKDAAAVLRDMETDDASVRAHILTTFMSSISTGFSGPLGTMRELAEGRDDVVGATEPMRLACQKLLAVRDGASPGTAAQALDKLAEIPEVHVFRRELLWAVVDTLRDSDRTGYVELESALRRRRNLTSHVGRRLARCCAGSTLLLKGMEFDHAIVVDTGEFSMNELYVAITRGSKSLTILSPRNRIRFDLTS